jgi:hypothetical protein
MISGNLIFMDFQRWDADVADLMASYAAMPKHIAKKHLLASMKFAIRSARGIQVLKAMTPKAKTRTVRSGIKRDERRGTFSKGSQGWEKQKGGALRRAVTVNARYIGRNKDGVAVAVLGYKYGKDSKKAIWLEYGTSRGIEPRRMGEKAMKQIGPAVRSALGKQLAVAIDSANREIAKGKNPGGRPKK